MMQPSVTSSLRLKIDFAQASDPGRDPNKQVNEDSCGYVESRFGYLCVLCDGMGGHYGGKEASRTAITTIFEVIDQTPPNVTPCQALKAAVEEAARRVYRLGGPPENRTRPGSTVVAMLFHDGGVDVAHVGDSRAYVIRSNQIYPLTRDHSMVQGMIDAGMLTEEQAMGHPDANKITRALGMKPEVDVEVRPEPMELFAGDILMQSSDGLTDLALGHEILGATRQALASGGVAHACDMLVKMANDRGGHDNITVQMVRVIEVGPRAKQTIPGEPSNAPPSHSSSQALQPSQPQSLHGTMPMGVSPNGVAPTPIDGASPTMSEQPPATAQGWGPPMGASPTQVPVSQGPQALSQGAQNLQPYRIDQPQQLQLPPPSQRPHPTPAMTPQPSQAAPMYGTPLPPPAALPMQLGSTPPGKARGGIVYIIIGLSVAIAVLIILVLWALLSRS